MKKTKETAASLCQSIHRHLDNIEDMWAWSIKAAQRFKVGQRVEFSKKADRNGITRRIKGNARRGVVVALTPGCSMKVKIDGYSAARGFHHSFWNPVSASRGKTILF